MRLARIVYASAFCFAVLAATEGLAYAQCDDGQTGNSVWGSCGACSGTDPNQKPLCTLTVQVRNQTFCQASAWRTQLDYPWQSSTKNEFGQCGAANQGGQPECLPTMALFQRTDVTSAEVKFKVITNSRELDTPNPGCKDGIDSVKEWGISPLGCCAGACSSQDAQTACAAAGKEYTSSGCVCAPPPPDCSSCSYQAPNLNYCAEDGGYYIEECGCCVNPWSPIIIDMAGDGFDLTNKAAGVMFDLNSDGTLDLLPWTSKGGNDAWLALDRNGNGRIDTGRELFGNFTAQPPSADPNGFVALAVFDSTETGGNGDGWIDGQDDVFSKLRLWRDANHDGVSQATELRTLETAGVSRISLAYRESKRIDKWGNWFRYRARAVDGKGRDIGGWAYDVYLAGKPPGERGKGR